VFYPTELIIKKNNGEGSIVRFSMAGCGLVDLGSNPSPRSKFFSFQKRKPCKRETNCKKKTTLRSGFPTAFQVIQLLSQQSFTQKQLAQKLGLTTRAVRYILSDLMKKGSILQRANLLDARQSYYEVIK
jgi:predicted HTH transcriptional regulator